MTYVMALLSIQTQCCQSQQIPSSIFQDFASKQLAISKIWNWNQCHFVQLIFLPSLLTFDICMPYTYFYTLCLSYTNSHDDNKYSIHYIMYIYVENWRCHNFLIFADNNTKYTNSYFSSYIAGLYCQQNVVFLISQKQNPSPLLF